MSRELKLIIRAYDAQPHVLKMISRINLWCSSDSSSDININGTLEISSVAGSWINYELILDEKLGQHQIAELCKLFNAQVTSIEPNFEHQQLHITFHQEKLPD